jgi:O-antigen/teichoic acid export membrane protein
MGNRTKNFVFGLSASYLATGVNIIYTALSVPLALNYLSKDEFGLWSLAQQIVGYLMLLDLGVSSAISRFIANHKDDVNGGDYGRLLLTGAIVFAFLGAFIVFAGLVFSIFAPTLFSIPPTLGRDFTNTLMVITSFAGFSFALRSLTAPLWAFQRMDILHLMSSLSLVTGFAALWFGFHLGWGIYSLALAPIPGILLSPAISFWISRRGGFYPSPGCWGRPNWTLFRRIFSFGQDIAWVTLGSQLVNASQIMILSRFAGLDVAATFAVGTKLFTLGQQLAGKIIESSAPGLTEMFVRGDMARFKINFSNIVSATTFVASLGATGLIAINTATVAIWTSGAIHWTLASDALLAGLLIASSLTRCLITRFILAGGYGPVRHIYFVEGCIFIAVAIPATTYYGIVGILTSSLVVHIVTTGFLSFLASEKELGRTKPFLRPLISGILTACLALAICIFLHKTFLSPITMLLCGAIIFSLSTLTGWFCFIPAGLRADWLSRLSSLAKGGGENRIFGRF